MRGWLRRSPDVSRDVAGRFRGLVEEIAEGHVIGWVHDAASPHDRIAVAALDGRGGRIASVADIYRADLQHAGIGDGHAGFSIALRALCGPERIEVVAGPEGEVLAGSPMSVRPPAAGRPRRVGSVLIGLDPAHLSGRRVSGWALDLRDPRATASARPRRSRPPARRRDARESLPSRQGGFGCRGVLRLRARATGRAGAVRPGRCRKRGAPRERALTFVPAAPRMLLALERGHPCGAGFEDLACALSRAGAEVTLAEVGMTEVGLAEVCMAGRLPRRDGQEPFRRLAIGPPPFALVCGSGRARATASLRGAYALDHAVRNLSFDLALAPLRGGLAHGLLMRRAVGDARAPARIALWADAPSRWLALREDVSPDGIAPLVADALERTSLRLADAVICPNARGAERLRSLGEPLPPVIAARLPAVMGTVGAGAGRGAIDEIVFVGRVARRDGAAAFMDAVEELVRTDALGDRLVTFLGPLDDPPGALGASLLGLRSTRWPFRFAVVEAATEREILAHLSGPGKLAVFAAEDGTGDRLLRGLIGAGRPVVATATYNDAAGIIGGVPTDAASLASALAAALQDGGTGIAISGLAATEQDDACDLLARLVQVTPRRPPNPPRRAASVSVCLLHRFRPALLANALASVRAGPALEVESVVLDNAGDPPLPPDLPGARVVRLDRPIPPGAAYNRAAAGCSGDVLVFLDDDNVLVEGGLERFAAALGHGWFDVVVTTLDLVDGPAQSGPSTARAVFLGDAGMAGLFFNGFGDTALAIRREAFARIGGFPEPGHLAPVWDWVLLARARAAGLRIGVLMDPAIRYARRVGDDLNNWLKLDREGGRRAVLEAYGEALDAPLLARFAQGAHLRG